MEFIKRFLLTILLILFLGTNSALCIEDINLNENFFEKVKLTNGKVLHISECVILALKNSPKIRRKKYELDIAKNKIGIAKSDFFPTITAGVGLNFEKNTDSIYYNKRYRDLPSVGVSINQLIWNFGKTSSYIKMEEFYKISAEYDFMDTLCATLFDIKEKYYSLLKAKALLNLAKNNIRISEDFLKLSSNRDDADLYTAKINLSQAKIQHIEAENTYKNAITDLSNAMYINTDIKYTIDETQSFTYNENYVFGINEVEKRPFIPYQLPFTLEEAEKIAYENSPDLRVLINTKKAMTHSLNYIKRIYYPNLTANLGYGYNNSNYTGHNISNNGLRVGVNFSSSLNLMNYKYNIKAAEAQLNIADNEILLFKKNLYYELQKAFNNVDRAKKQVPMARTEIDQALKNLQIVEAQYENKKLDYTSLQDARKDYINALSSYIDGIYNYNMAIIQLEMAMHYHLADIYNEYDKPVHSHSLEFIDELNQYYNKTKI